MQSVQLHAAYGGFFHDFSENVAFARQCFPELFKIHAVFITVYIAAFGDDAVRSLVVKEVVGEAEVEF